MPIIEEARRQIGAVERHFDIRLAATWGTQLQLVEAQENAVRFPHSILQAYLGSRLIGYAMADGKFRKEALDNAGRELLIALVMHSRAEPKQRTARQPAGSDAAAPVPAGTNRSGNAPDGTGSADAGRDGDRPGERETFRAGSSRAGPSGANGARPDDGQPGGTRRRRQRGAGRAARRAEAAA